MKRMLSIIGAALLAACPTEPDMQFPADLAISDRTIDEGRPREDLPPIVSDPQMLTGEPCTSDGDCAPGALSTQKGVCQRRSGTGAGVDWPGGFCTSPCRAGRDEDCPGVRDSLSIALCENAQCFIPCLDHQADCREGYVCASIGEEYALCVPEPLSGCSPATPASCADATEVCVSFSPDDSYGECAARCDVFQQGCADDPPGTRVACLADPDSGVMSCVPPVTPAPEGQPCRYLNGCEPGFACHTESGAGVCRRYCGGPNPIDCPAGQQCRALSPMSTVPIGTVGLCAP